MERLAKSVNARPLSIYLSIPGIAKITAARLVAELDDLRRFDTSAKIDAVIDIEYNQVKKTALLGLLSMAIILLERFCIELLPKWRL